MPTTRANPYIEKEGLLAIKKTAKTLYTKYFLFINFAY